MATKLGKAVTYRDGFLLIKLLDPSITCSYEMTWQPKIIITMFPLYRIGFYNAVKSNRYNGNNSVV